MRYEELLSTVSRKGVEHFKQHVLLCVVGIRQKECTERKVEILSSKLSESHYERRRVLKNPSNVHKVIMYTSLNPYS